MSLATMANNILRFCPGLNLDLVKSTIQDSYRQLCVRDWNRLKLTRQIYTAAPYSTGTVEVSTAGIVTPAGGVFSSTMVGRFMKVYYTDAFFEIESYTVIGGTLTLKDWPGVAVAAGTSYSIFKTIYPVDSSFKQIWDVVHQISLKKKTQSYFNKIDPSRTSTSSSPIAWALAESTSIGDVQIEIYPIPTAVVLLRVYGKVGALTLADADTPKLPEDLIEDHALITCYRLKDLKEPGQGWGDKMMLQKQMFDLSMSDFEEEDYQLGEHSDRVKDMMGEVVYPTDDNFALSHDVD